MTREQAALLLGVDVDASTEQVNHAWRVWAKLAHPDLGGDRGHFEALAVARAVLAGRAARPAPQEQSSSATEPSNDRDRLRDMCRRPSPRGTLAIVLAALGSVIAVAIAPSLSDFGAALAVATAACVCAVAIQRSVLREAADVGHRIALLTLAWFPTAALLAVMVAYHGVAIIGLLPVVALPFVVAVALVNPGAGLWRPIRQTS